jgi:hypothetical protein
MYIIFPQYSLSYTLLLYTLPATDTNPKTGTVLKTWMNPEDIKLSIKTIHRRTNAHAIT